MKRVVCISVVAVLLVLSGCAADSEESEHNTIGTPLIGPPGYSSYGGKVPGPVSAGGVSISVHDVSIGDSPADGYATLFVEVKFVNESDMMISVLDATLVDDFSNRYACWGFDQEDIGIDPGEEAAGLAEFRVPIVALDREMRLRWESDRHKVRLELFFEQ